jgi:hypothetical protein
MMLGASVVLVLVGLSSVHRVHELDFVDALMSLRVLET